jgi:hypothetical protein
VAVTAPAVPVGWLRYLVPAFVVLPVVGVLLLLPVQSLFIDEYLAAFLLPAALLVGGVLGAVRRDWWTGIPAVGIVVAGLVGIAGVWQQPVITNQDWRSATRLLDGEVRPADAVTFPNTFYRVAAEYYARSGAAWQQARPILPTDPWGSQPPRRYDELKRLGTYTTESAVQAGLGGQARVWLVGPEDAQMAFFRRVLGGSGYRQLQVQHVAGLAIEEYEHPAG